MKPLLEELHAEAAPGTCSWCGEQRKVWPPRVRYCSRRCKFLANSAARIDWIRRHERPPGDSAHSLDRRRPENRTAITKAFLGRLCRMRRDGWLKSEIAREIGFSERHVARLLERAGAK